MDSVDYDVALALAKAIGEMGSQLEQRAYNTPIGIMDVVGTIEWSSQVDNLQQV